jgi:hypothetical protein
LIHRIVEPDSALFDEDHRARRGDGLGRGGEPENRVSPHRHVTVEVQGADHFGMLVTASMNERDQAWNLTTPDVPLEDCVHSRETGARESPVPGPC